MKPAMVQMLICDDEQIISDGLREVFAKDERLEVCNVYSAAQMFEVLDHTQIDIVLLDIHMPRMNGLEALSKIKESWPFCYVVMLTGYDNFDYIYEATAYSGVKYILKQEGYDKITKTVDAVIDEILTQNNVIRIMEMVKELQEHYDDNQKKETGLYKIENQRHNDDNGHKIVQFIKRYVDRHLEEPDKITLLHISEMLHFNSSYLSRLFKQLTGVNLSEYIIGSKMNMAKRLLLNPEYKIADVAVKLGYTSPANFTRVFRKTVGLSPHDYRTNHVLETINL